MRKIRMIAVAAALAFGWVGSAHAADVDPCGAKMVCASDPQTIVTALQAAGYKAALGKSETTGNPTIDSAASGYNFTIYFYECEEAKKCGSVQFLVTFSDDGGNTADFANKWNNNKRFSQMSVSDDKSLNFAYDLSTIGGLNQKNFADVLDWWSVMLGEVSKFFKENPAPAKK